MQALTSRVSCVKCSHRESVRRVKHYLTNIIESDSDTRKFNLTRSNNWRGSNSSTVLLRKHIMISFQLIINVRSILN